MPDSSPHSVWDDFERVRSALGPRVPIKHSSYLERVSNETLDALQRIEEQLEAYRKALDEIAHWPGSWSGETAIMLRDHARVALDSNPAKGRE